MEILVDPTFAYLMLMGAGLFALLALLTPGTGILELTALFCLVLAGYAVTQLNINLWSLVLIALSLIPFLHAIRRPRHFLALAISLAGIIVGSAYLFQNQEGGPAVNPIVATFASILYAALVWIAVQKTLQAHLAPPAHNLNALIGEIGEAKTAIGQEGSVQVAGELWSARSKNGTVIPPGEPVRVIGREGFTLEVEALSSQP